VSVKEFGKVIARHKYMSALHRNMFSKYSFVWVTAVLFLASLGAHWTFAWYSYVKDQQEHHQPIEVKDYLTEVSRDTFENWQSEFLQLIWQVAGLAYLFYLGSPQSKEGDDRKEEKLDRILTMLDEQKGKQAIQQLDEKYPRK
jgi:hypothetical protein